MLRLSWGWDNKMKVSQSIFDDKHVSHQDQNQIKLDAIFKSLVRNKKRHLSDVIFIMQESGLKYDNILD